MTSCGGTSSVTKEAARVFQAASLGSVGYEPEINAKGERLIWLEPHVTSTGFACSRAGREPQILRLAGKQNF
jgi:hypothetical protein